MLAAPPSERNNTRRNSVHRHCALAVAPTLSFTCTLDRLTAAIRSNRHGCDNLAGCWLAHFYDAKTLSTQLPLIGTPTSFPQAAPSLYSKFFLALATM